jgi:DNA polymerase Ligase (LigD)
MPRFVILHHETPAGYSRPAHFDLMLEHGSVLHTWALDALPAVGETVAAELLPDHRLAYLDFQGEISGQRGSVTRVDAGEYEMAEESTARIVLQIHGEKLSGILTMMKPDGENQRWRVSLSAG